MNVHNSYPFVTGRMPNKSPDTRGRFDTEQRWYHGGGAMTRTFEHNYEVDEQSPFGTISQVPAARWDKGIFYKFSTPVLRPPRERWMYDPTDPATWHNTGPGT